MVSLAVLYNIIFVVGRSVFWEINKNAPAVWYTLDYLCDFIYLLDTLVHMHEGKLPISVSQQTGDGRGGGRGREVMLLVVLRLRLRLLMQMRLGGFCSD